MNRKKRFVYYSSPEHWFQAALELNTSVEELYFVKDKSYFHQNFHYIETTTVKRSVFSRAIYLLMAYSLENLLKGTAVLRDASLVNLGKLKKEIKTHKLNDLSIYLKYKLTLEQRKFQEILSVQCISNARYPVGLNECIELENPSVAKKDFKIYKQLFAKFKKSFVREFHKNGWDSGLKDEDLKTEPKEFKYWENN